MKTPAAYALASFAAGALVAAPSAALAQPDPNAPDAAPTSADAGASAPPEPPPAAPEPAAPPPAAPVDVQPPAPPAEAATPAPPEEAPMSEGRAIVSAYNSGFHWGIAPGIVWVNGSAGAAVGLRFGYGFDTGSVIVVPGIGLTGFFTSPSVYLGIPEVRLVYPIDRFAPFVVGGAGFGAIGGDGSAAKNGLALLGGGGFVVHFSQSFGLGVEATYTTITGADFSAVSVGPILAIAF